MRRMIKYKVSIKGYSVTIKASCSNWIITLERDIKKVKEIFSKKKEAAIDLADEWDYLKCIYLLDWSIECEATSVKIKNSLTEQCLEFKFAFDKFEDMTKFINNLDSNVNSKYFDEISK